MQSRPVRNTGGQDDPTSGARDSLIFLLQLAYSGELGAARAYAGHRASVRDPLLRLPLGRILKDELHHRHVLFALLAELGSAPDPRRERKLNFVGRIISTVCFVFSIGQARFIPLYGAGRLEGENIGEYEHAAQLALVAGLPALVEPLLLLAECEWDHELWFREACAGYVLWRIVPHWPSPPPRAAIRATYAAFAASGSRKVRPVRVPWLVR